ncbi:MAG: membrane protein insertase YidC, partial [Lentisphaerae bacterium]|nr:membrane protein insertase YidC [Lentisphaerota bacterium]
IAGLGKDADFELSILDDGRSAHIKAKAEGGLYFERLLFLTNGYNIAIIDSLRNSSDVAVSVPRHKIVLGPMELKDKNSSDLELAVSISSSQNGRQNVSEINSKTKRTGFTSQFGAAGGGCSAATVPLTSPLSVSSVREADVSWLAVRERFFVQVLTPASHSPAMESTAWRNPSAPGNALQIKRVSAALIEDETVLEPGASVSKEHSLFIGPRKMSELRKMGSEYTKIMSFGTWAFFCKMLLDLLNFLYSIIPNYGIAIILLTALVRLLLFPVNKRNAESMRKMAEVQPLIKEVQEKYKDDPKKLQAETMRIYGEKKINPLASCLPMFIQLPIFIALFTVLRSAVELRYASFLWISDLSAPENLFREHFGFGVNILPIAMALTMALQSSLTPTTGDRQQQRMMMVMMPVMMLLICYNFASALSLYWTVSQVLAIAGLLWSRRKRERDSGESEAVLVKETRQMRRDRLRRESR